MSYRLSKFGSTALPCARLTGSLGSGPTVDATIPTIGGMFDAYSTGTGNLDVPYEITHGCWIVDDEADAQTTLENLYAMRGTRNILYRTDEVSSALNWCWARCTQVRNPWQWQRKTMNPLDITFQIQTPWYGAVTGTGWSLDTGATLDATLISGAVTTTIDIVPKQITLTNNGNVATRHVSFRMTAVATPAINCIVQIDLGSKFEWQGTVPTGQVLQVIQRQNYAAVTLNGVAAYSGVKLATNYGNGWWLELQPGNNTAYVTHYGGADTTITFDHADGWG